MKCPICKSTFTGSECPDCSTEQKEVAPTATQIANAMWDEAYRDRPISPKLREQAEGLGMLVARLPDVWAKMACYDYTTLDLFDRWLHYTGQEEAQRAFMFTLRDANIKLPFHMSQRDKREQEWRLEEWRKP